MKRLLIIQMIIVLASALPLCAQTPVHDKSREKQWQAMESGKIEFTPKEYYMLVHGEPGIENLWLGDSYSVYDQHLQWQGIHTHFEWKFNSKKSKAVNVLPKRELAFTELILTDQQYKEMMDTVNHQLLREMGKAADCEIDKYWDAYKEDFQRYDRSIADLMTRYIIGSGGSSSGRADKFGVIDDIVGELAFLRETASNTHNSYMESILKNDVYADVLQRYKKLHKKMFWRVVAVEESNKNK